MSHPRKKILCGILCALFLSAWLPIPASADTGPKPSVHITFEHMGEELCYGTLLSRDPSTGPFSVWDGDEDHIIPDQIDLAVWKAFVAYEDEDGYSFLQIGWQVNEKKEFAWTYYPPKSFKILLYYPETDQYAVSGICERYAFDTYYTVDMTGTKIGAVDYDEERSTDERLYVHPSYPWPKEALSLALRILITIAIEIGIGLLFGLRDKKVLWFLAAVNTFTQILLNVLLNGFYFPVGSKAYVAGYIGLEFAVFALEAVLYILFMKKLTEKTKPAWYYVLYALAANALSFLAGLVLAPLWPGLF